MKACKDSLAQFDAGLLAVKLTDLLGLKQEAVAVNIDNPEAGITICRMLINP